MADELLRRLERKAASGDFDAVVRLHQMRERFGLCGKPRGHRLVIGKMMNIATGQSVAFGRNNTVTINNYRRDDENGKRNA